MFGYEMRSPHEIVLRKRIVFTFNFFHSLINLTEADSLVCVVVISFIGNLIRLRKVLGGQQNILLRVYMAFLETIRS